MTVKAVCTLERVISDGTDNTKFRVSVHVAGLVASNGVSETIETGPFAANIGSSYLTADIKTAVETYLTNNHGYSFGILDEVRLLGVLV